MEGKIGGDSLLSPRGMQYADALPALVTDNIGDAPLTVSLRTKNHLSSMFQSNAVTYMQNLIVGLDIDIEENDSDCEQSTIP